MRALGYMRRRAATPPCGGRDRAGFHHQKGYWVSQDRLSPSSSQGRCPRARLSPSSARGHFGRTILWGKTRRSRFFEGSFSLFFKKTLPRRAFRTNAAKTRDVLRRSHVGNDLATRTRGLRNTHVYPERLCVVFLERRSLFSFSTAGEDTREVARLSRASSFERACFRLCCCVARERESERTAHANCRWFGRSEGPSRVFLAGTRPRRASLARAKLKKRHEHSKDAAGLYEDVGNALLEADALHERLGEDVAVVHREASGTRLGHLYRCRMFVGV